MATAQKRGRRGLGPLHVAVPDEERMPDRGAKVYAEGYFGPASPDACSTPSHRWMPWAAATPVAKVACSR